MDREGKERKKEERKKERKLGVVNRIGTFNQEMSVSYFFALELV